MDGYKTYSQTFKEYPIYWYEVPKVKWIIIIFLIPFLAHIQMKIGIPADPKVAAVGLLIYFVAWLGDTYTTALIIRLKPQFDRRNIEFPVREQNPLLPIYPTNRQLVLSLSNLVSALLSLVVFIVPIASIFLLVIQGGQALENFRIWLRLKLTIKILLSK